MGKFMFFIIKLFGWNIDSKVPDGVKKAVVVMGPHTTNWDFIIGRIAFAKYGVNGKYLVKKELFFPGFGWFLRSVGAVPVDRKANNNFTDQAVKHFTNNETMFMVFTPEGTRKHNPHWKKGFYYIALKAKVPIYIGYIDYKRKIGGFHSLFEPTGNAKEDIRKIKEILSNYQGKYPDQGILKEDIYID